MHVQRGNAAVALFSCFVPPVAYGGDLTGGGSTTVAMEVFVHQCAVRGEVSRASPRCIASDTVWRSMLPAGLHLPAEYLKFARYSPPEASGTHSKSATIRVRQNRPSASMAPSATETGIGRDFSTNATQSNRQVNDIFQPHQQQRLRPAVRKEIDEFA